MTKTKVKAKIHWHDLSSGDGMIQLSDGQLVYFYDQSALWPDNTRVIAEIITDYAWRQAVVLDLDADYRKRV